MLFLLYSVTIFASIGLINADQSVDLSPLTRKREYNAVESELGEELNDFGELEEDWFRLLQEFSVPSISGCSYDIDLDCHLSDDLNVSI
jgi:hypothetical protein